jgi:hypothetical protein
MLAEEVTGPIPGFCFGNPEPAIEWLSPGIPIAGQRLHGCQETQVLSVEPG